jgi:hypothetical protein
MSGYYAKIDLSASKILHRHFCDWVNEEDFLADSLKSYNPEHGIIEALPTLPEECAIWSNCLNCTVKAYAYKDCQVIYTDNLFTEEEMEKFQNMYNDSLSEGVRPQLATRDFFKMEEYIYGIIELSLKTKKATNGCLEISFPDFDAQCVDTLYCAKMIYTVPLPGFFKKIEVDEARKTILFYV